jgi:hypothetical protein
MGGVRLQLVVFNGKCFEAGFTRARRDKYNWVCFSCRKSVGRLGGAKYVVCSRCAKLCADIGCKMRVPPLGRKREWQGLQKAFEKWQQVHAQSRRGSSPNNALQATKTRAPERRGWAA